DLSTRSRCGDRRPARHDPDRSRLHRRSRLACCCCRRPARRRTDGRAVLRHEPARAPAEQLHRGPRRLRRPEHRRGRGGAGAPRQGLVQAHRPDHAHRDEGVHARHRGPPRDQHAAGADYGVLAGLLPPHHVAAGGGSPVGAVRPGPLRRRAPAPAAGDARRGHLPVLRHRRSVPGRQEALHHRVLRAPHLPRLVGGQGPRGALPLPGGVAAARRPGLPAQGQHAPQLLGDLVEQGRVVDGRPRHRLLLPHPPL
ncbi:MAG: hypothetical protein AVDCRST_MAG32-686, partial [uncultured Nocardioides sp.]